MSEVEFVHPVPVDEAEAWAAAAALTFLEDPAPEAHPGSDEFRRRIWDAVRGWGARADGVWGATLATRGQPLTVPGRDDLTLEVTADALTMVTVAATHRRRGLLSHLLSESLQAAHGRGDAVAILYAAEWPIYGRFGYAPATMAARYVVDPRFPAARVTPAELGHVRRVRPDEYGTLAPTVFAAARRQRAGNIERRAVWWQRFAGLDGLPAAKTHGRLPNLFVHEGAAGPDGFLAWVATRDFDPDAAPGAIEVVDFGATNDEAYRNLWAYLTGMDLVGEISVPGRPVDELVRWLLPDGRALRQAYLGDALWVRVLDVEQALAGRRYAVEDELVLDIVDDDRGTFAAGRYALGGGPDGAQCRRTSAAADVMVHQRALAAAYLGGSPLRTKIAAGLVEECRPGVLRRLDAMFSTPLAPWSATEF